MRIYIATSLENRANAVRCAEWLKQLGYRIVSEWHDNLTNDRDKDRAISNDKRTQIAELNYRHIDQADVLVFLNHPDCKGSLIEVGYAYGGRKPVICVDCTASYSRGCLPVTIPRPTMIANLNWCLSEDLYRQLHGVSLDLARRNREVSNG